MVRRVRHSTCRRAATPQGTGLPDNRCGPCTDSSPCRGTRDPAGGPTFGDPAGQAACFSGGSLTLRPFSLGLPPRTRAGLGREPPGAGARPTGPTEHHAPIAVPVRQRETTETGGAGSGAGAACGTASPPLHGVARAAAGARLAPASWSSGWPVSCPPSWSPVSWCCWSSSRYSRRSNSPWASRCCWCCSPVPSQRRTRPSGPPPPPVAGRNAGPPLPEPSSPESLPLAMPEAAGARPPGGGSCRSALTPAAPPVRGHRARRRWAPAAVGDRLIPTARRPYAAAGACGPRRPLVPAARMAPLSSG